MWKIDPTNTHSSNRLRDVVVRPGSSFGAVPDFFLVPVHHRPSGLEPRSGKRRTQPQIHQSPLGGRMQVWSRVGNAWGGGQGRAEGVSMGWLASSALPRGLRLQGSRVYCLVHNIVQCVGGNAIKRVVDRNFNVNYSSPKPSKIISTAARKGKGETLPRRAAQQPAQPSANSGRLRPPFLPPKSSQSECDRDEMGNTLETIPGPGKVPPYGTR